MTRYGKSPWIDRYPTSRVPVYPRQRGAAQTSVVIVGGGLTGCATAYAFAAAGVDVILFEAGRIGHGSTGSAIGWIAGEPGAAFMDVEKTLGRKLARDTFRAWRRAALDFRALLRRIDIKCALQPAGAATVAVTPDEIARLTRDLKARRDAGLNAAALNARVIRSEFGLDAGAASRDKDGAAFDPYRACLGLAAAARDRGARLFEHTAVRRITFGRRNVDIFTAHGQIRAARVVIATGVPTPLHQSLARHFWFRTAYLALTSPIPAKIRHLVGTRASIVRDTAAPPHTVRWVQDERLLIAGADTLSGPPRTRDKTIVQRTGQLMYELSTLYPDVSGIQPAYGWDAAYGRTNDGLPFIGPHRNHPHHLFAFGDSSTSATGAYLASRILLRHHLGELEPADEHFAFTRYER
ncbi:MAG: FAD-binding oxidoreductase [Vicinamibacterales bacterium]